MLLPAAVIAVIWFLWALPQWLRRSSFRPGEPWVGEPLWVGAPRELGRRNLRATSEETIHGKDSNGAGNHKPNLRVSEQSSDKFSM